MTALQRQVSGEESVVGREEVRFELIDAGTRVGLLRCWDWSRTWNALAELPVIEPRGGSVILSRGGKSLRDQRVLI